MAAAGFCCCCCWAMDAGKKTTCWLFTVSVVRYAGELVMERRAVMEGALSMRCCNFQAVMMDMTLRTKDTIDMTKRRAKPM